MSFPNWLIPVETVFSAASVIPVIVIRDIDQAIPLAETLFANGIKVLEVTLRTPIALDAVKLLTKTFPAELIGVGTVITGSQYNQAVAAGAKFAISPGLTQELLHTGRDGAIPFIPGIASVSELMQGIALGYSHFKFFPAAVAGGIPMLRAMHGPFPEVKFCPTGGINKENFNEYLALPNVSCVGGSWIVPEIA